MLGVSLKCYHCGLDLRDTFSKQICGDPFYKNDSLLIDCESSEFIGCAKADIGGTYVRVLNYYLYYINII